MRRLNLFLLKTKSIPTFAAVILRSLSFLAGFLFLSSPLIAQITGVTGTKAVAVAVDVIPTHSIEFSPTWSFNSINGVYNSDGENVSSDEVSIQNGICWMVNYGLSEKVEVGINIPSTFEPITFAAKSELFRGKAFWGGAMIGLNIPLHDRSFDRDNPNPEDVSSFGLGLIGKVIVDEKSSLDVNAQYQDWVQDAEGLPKGAWFLTAEYGTYHLSDQLMLLAAANYQTFNFDSNSSKFQAGPGLSFEYGENFVIVVSTLHDLFGKDSEKGMFGQFGLTIILD